MTLQLPSFLDANSVERKAIDVVYQKRNQLKTPPFYRQVGKEEKLAS